MAKMFLAAAYGKIFFNPLRCFTNGVTQADRRRAERPDLELERKVQGSQESLEIGRFLPIGFCQSQDIQK
jgi:hypothetical protein